jgi:hypothetical protein
MTHWVWLSDDAWAWLWLRARSWLCHDSSLRQVLRRKQAYLTVPPNWASYI